MSVSPSEEVGQIQHWMTVYDLSVSQELLHCGSWVVSMVYHPTNRFVFLSTNIRFCSNAGRVLMNQTLHFLFRFLLCNRQLVHSVTWVRVKGWVPCDLPPPRYACCCVCACLCVRLCACQAEQDASVLLHNCQGQVTPRPSEIPLRFTEQFTHGFVS